MSSLVKPLAFNPPVTDYQIWQEQHAREHSQLSAAAASIINNAGTRSSGTYEPFFQSGPVQFAGPNGSFLGSDNVIEGLALPTPSGISGPALLLGTGGTTNPSRSFWIITDQAFDPTLNGNLLGITAGETQGSGTANGGLLWLLGGASFGGIGGEMRVQGGTSRLGPGGPLNLFGGNSTGAPPGDVFVVAGQAGTQGANIHLIMTTINGISGFLRIRNNSNILYEFDATGAIFIGATGAGLVGSPLISGGPNASPHWELNNFTGNVTIARLTPGGSNGVLTFLCGMLTNVVPAA